MRRRTRYPRPTMILQNEQAIAETRAWVNRAVIGLNLCPFAKAVQVKGLVRYVASDASDDAALLADLEDELLKLANADPSQLDTTLLVHPQVLTDFVEFSYFLQAADALLKTLGLSGTLQIASFHPNYQFANTEPGDITNATNRSPYPTLHLLREESIDRAVAAFPDAKAIYANNMSTLEALGQEAWEALREQCRRDAIEDT
ncbi:MAG: hypothetical protein JWN23_2561 [Rhodocyclales bacterium]|nr:hypothetical protein [Rhodocyclales bacterium]